ncbi:MAG TPA: tetratricopeptide repeat protein [Tepidisphaeraceae bacterium]
MLRRVFLMPVMLLGVAIGCSQQKQVTQKEAAHQQWNAARANVMLSLAKGQYDTGNFDKSRQTVDEALKYDDTNAQLHILSAKLAIEQGQLEWAQKELDRARGLDTHNAEADYLCGVIYQRWQKPETAFEFYGSACEKAPAELAYLMAKAEMLVAMDRAKEALALLQAKVVYFEHSSAIRDAAGQLLQTQGRHVEAAEMFRQASILAPEDVTARERLGLSLYYGKQYADGADVLGRLVKEEAYERRADVILALGECQMQTGKYREARSTFETAVQVDPSMSQGWASLGKSALQLKDYKRAELSLKKALSLDPQSSEINLMIGFLRLRQDRFSDAMASFQQANNLDRADTVSLCLIGYILEKSGRGDQAMGYYAQALRLKPNDELATKLMAGVDLHE